jgi:hypothetical protein
MLDNTVTQISIQIIEPLLSILFSSYPNGIRILDEFLQLFADDFLVLLPVAFKENAFAKLPGPPHSRDVLQNFLGVCFAVLKIEEGALK